MDSQIALGAMFSPCLSVLGTYFRRKRAFVVEIAASGTAVGAVAFPIMLEHLFAQVGLKLAILYRESLLIKSVKTWSESDQLPTSQSLSFNSLYSASPTSSLDLEKSSPHPLPSLDHHSSQSSSRSLVNLLHGWFALVLSES